MSTDAVTALPPLLRSRAGEIKFLLSPEVGVRIREWAIAAIPADHHAHAGCCDHYQVSSLYFDTKEWSVFNKLGSYRRSKYRIRRYNRDDRVFLERKIKTGGQVSKWRSLADIEDLASLNLEALPMKGHGAWFQRRLRARRLEPVCRIRYRRLARQGENRYGRFRLTLDDGIRAESIRRACFLEKSAAGPEVDCCPEGVVLEMKFGDFMPALFKQMIEEFQLSETGFSKYRSAVQKLGLPSQTEVYA